MQTLDDTTTVIDLEQLVNGDDCKCESAHKGSGIGPCSHAVVARKFHCEGSLNICRTSYEWNLSTLRDPLRICAGCKRDTAVCWQIILI